MAFTTDNGLAVSADERKLQILLRFIGGVFDYWSPRYSDYRDARFDQQGRCAKIERIQLLQTAERFGRIAGCATAPIASASRR